MLVTCSNKEKTDHCKYVCLHGDIHQKDECVSYQFCNIVKKKIRCRKLFKRELKLLGGE